MTRPHSQASSQTQNSASDRSAQPTPNESRAPVSVSMLVYEHLREQILSGVISPGESLPGERKLSTTLGVNRGAVREGLKRLEQAGLVTIQHGGSTRVLDYHHSPALDLMAELTRLPNGEPDARVMRSFLELHVRLIPHVARLAAERAGADLGPTLRRIQNAIGLAASPQARLDQMVGFWQAAADACNNIAYAFAFNTLVKLAGQSSAQEVEDHLQKIDLGDYETIITAIESGDGDRAEALADKHMRALHRDSLAALESFSEDATRFMRCAEPMEADLAERRPGVADAVFARIRDGIVSGALAPGSCLPGERVLSQEIGVNRGAVREALKRLEHAGLVSIQHGGATRVHDLRRSGAMSLLIEILYQPDGELRTEITRSMLELRTRVTPDMARLAARRIDDRTARALMRRIEAADAEGDNQELRLPVWEVIALASDNLCYSFVTRLAHETLRALRDQHRELAIRRIKLESLRPIAEAILAHDEERAYALALTHAGDVAQRAGGALEGAASVPETQIA